MSINQIVPSTVSAIEEIKSLEAKILELRRGQLEELKTRREGILAELGSIDKEISKHTAHDVQQIRKFLALNPSVLKQQGAGSGTRYFLP